MKYSTALAAFAAAGLASAQSLDDVPQCARQCLGPAIKETGCAETDISCMCKAENRQKVVVSGTPCVLSGCGEDVAIKEVLPAITTLCEKVLSGGSADNTILPGTTMPSSSIAVPTSGVTGSMTLSLPTSAVSTMVTTSTAPSGTGVGTNSTATGAPVPAGAPKLTGLGGAAMLALAAFAAY